MKCPYYNEDCPKCNPTPMTHTDQFEEIVNQAKMRNIYGTDLEWLKYSLHHIRQEAEKETFWKGYDEGVNVQIAQKHLSPEEAIEIYSHLDPH